MKRKVIKQGPASLVVSLPSKWVKKNNIKQGDEVDVEEESNGLFIALEKRSRKYKKVEISIKGVVRKIHESQYHHVKNTLSSLYKKGYNEIHIKFDDPDVEKHIKRVVASLMGYELIELKKNFCIVKELMKPNEEQLKSVERRCYIIMKEYARIVYNEMMNGYKENKELIVEKIKIIGKHNDFYKKLLVDSDLDKFEIMYRYSHNRTFEFSLREFFHAYVFAYDHKVKVDKRILNFFKKYLEALDFFYTMFFKFDPDQYYKAMNYRNLFFEEGYPLMMKLKKEQVIILSHIMAALRRFANNLSILVSLNY